MSPPDGATADDGARPDAHPDAPREMPDDRSDVPDEKSGGKADDRPDDRPADGPGDPSRDPADDHSDEGPRDERDAGRRGAHHGLDPDHGRVDDFDHPERPHGHAPTAADQVEVDEPLLAARVHRPSDLVRLLVGILGIAVVLAIAAFAHGTTAGLEEDISNGTGQAPDLLIKVAGLVSSIAVLLVPVAFAIERLIKRDGLRIADGVLAAVLAHGVTLATDLWVSQAASATIQDSLTLPTGTAGALTDPVHGYLAPVIAYMTAVGMTRRPRWRVALWVVLLLDAFAMLVSGYTTPSRSS